MVVAADGRPRVRVTFVRLFERADHRVDLIQSLFELSEAGITFQPIEDALCLLLPLPLGPRTGISGTANILFADRKALMAGSKQSPCFVDAG